MSQMQAGSTPVAPAPAPAASPPSAAPAPAPAPADSGSGSGGDAQPAAATATATTAATGQQQQSAAAAPAPTQPAAPGPQPSSAQLLHRSKKQLQELASLPSHDREAYYDYSAHSGQSESEEEDCSTRDRNPRITNRGNKLTPGAVHVRRGRLGGWDNYEIFTSRSAFPGESINAASSAGAGSASAAATAAAARLPSLSAVAAGGGAAGASLLDGSGTGNHRQLQQSGYHSITPNLALVPTSSTLAARPDRDIHLTSYIPSKNAASGLESDQQYLVHTKKRRKLHTTHSGLASTSGPSANHTSAPIRAYLPIPPQNPVELVASPLVSRTFSPKNRTLEKLALSATDLIEQDIPLLRALTRLVDFMRGNCTAGLQSAPGGGAGAGGGSLGLPFEGDGVESMVQPERKPEPELEAEAKPVLEGQEEQAEKVHTEEVNGDSAAAAAASGQMAEGNETDAMQVDGDGENKAAAAVDQDSTAGSEAATTDPAAAQNGEQRKRRRGSGSMDQDDAASAAGEAEAGPAAAATAEAALASNEAAHSTDPADAQTQADDVPVPVPAVPETTGTAAIAEAEIAAAASAEEEGSQHDSDSERAQAQAPLATAALPASVVRIAEPQSYIDHLFISHGPISLPSPAGEGEEPSGSGAGEPVVLGRAEQQATLQLCLGELSKFLSDSLEYRDRLGEIRDQTLGVEKRRKGVWNMARAYAHQIIWEETSGLNGAGEL